MKATISFLTFVFAFSLFSFSNNFSRIEQITSKDDKSTDTLYILGSGHKYENNASIPIPPELVFTGEDIISFNLITREIVFTDASLKKFFPGYNGLKYYIHLSFYLNDKLLFYNIWYSPPIENLVKNDLVLYLDFNNYGGNLNYRFYLNNGHPPVFEPCYSKDIQEIWQKERDENAQKRKPEWDLFIQYLRNAGKLIGDDVNNMEPVASPELNSISISPNPTSGELRIMNYELGITSIRIFDIMGKNVLTQTPYPPSPYPPYPLSSEVNISHLPAGIYFVQITTEKGVVVKKVIKK